MTDDETEGLRGLWADLEQEVQETDETPLVAIPRSQVNRRATLGERLAGAFFSGFLPAFLVLTCGGMMAALEAPLLAERSLEGVAGLVAVVLILGLPLAWLLAPLLKTDRSTLPRMLLVCLLAGGILEVGMAIPIAGLKFLADKQLSPTTTAQLLQRSYELYLSAGSLAVFGLLAVLLTLSQTRLRRALPWVEMRRAPALTRLLVAALVAASPLLMLAGLGAAQGRIAPDLVAWADSVREGARISPNVYHRYQPWSTLREELVKKDENYFAATDRRVPAWSADVSRAAEQKALQLFAQKIPAEPWPCADVVNALLARPEQLEDPEKLAMGQLSMLLAARPTWGALHSRQTLDILLSRLATSPMTAEQMRAEMAEIEGLDALIPSDPESEFSRSLYEVYISENSRLLERPGRRITALGFELPVSLPGLADEWEMGRNLETWSVQRPSLDYSGSAALEMSVDKAFPEHQNRDLNMYVKWAAGRVYSLQLRPYFQSARVILALRLFKLETGSYPTSLSSLQLPADFHSDSWDYQTLDGGQRAKLSRPNEPAFGPRAKVTLWTLP